MSFTSFDCSYNPWSYAIDKEGNTYVTICNVPYNNNSSYGFDLYSIIYVTNGILQKISKNGDVSIIYLDETPWSDLPSYTTLTMNPIGITIDDENNLYLANLASSWIPGGRGFISKYSLDNSANSIYNFFETNYYPFQLYYLNNELFISTYNFDYFKLNLIE